VALRERNVEYRLRELGGERRRRVLTDQKRRMRLTFVTRNVRRQLYREGFVPAARNGSALLRRGMGVNWEGAGTKESPRASILLERLFPCPVPGEKKRKSARKKEKALNATRKR